MALPWTLSGRSRLLRSRWPASTSRPKPKLSANLEDLLLNPAFLRFQTFQCRLKNHVAIHVWCISSKRSIPIHQRCCVAGEQLEIFRPSPSMESKTDCTATRPGPVKRSQM